LCLPACKLERERLRERCSCKLCSSLLQIFDSFAGRASRFFTLPCRGGDYLFVDVLIMNSFGSLLIFSPFGFGFNGRRWVARPSELSCKLDTSISKSILTPSEENSLLFTNLFFIKTLLRELWWSVCIVSCLIWSFHRGKQGDTERKRKS